MAIKEKGSQKKRRGGVPTLISRGWRSIIATLLALLLLCGNPAVLSAAINWTPKDINTGVTTSVPEAGNQGPKTKTENMLADMPLFFIENQGQIDKQVLYYTEGGNQGLYFTPSGLTFTLTKSQEPTNTSLNPEITGKGLIPQTKEQERWAVKLDFIGANNVKPYGEGLTPTQISYFKGQPEDWRTGLNTYSRIVYPELWPGIDLVFKGDSNGLKYEFTVAPGADPKQIKLAWQGAESVKINKQGGMEIRTPIGGFTDEAPIAWQGKNRQKIASSFCFNSGMNKNQEWGFKLGNYDPTRILIIDPVVIDYSGYIGGSEDDYSSAIAVDSKGRAYVTGYTFSTEADFPVYAGPDIESSGNGSMDAFVARVSANGTSLDYCGYIGGSAHDYGYGIAVDSMGRAYVTGNTYSSETDFPVINGPYTTYNGNSEAFVARLSANGTSLEYCSYIGGSENDIGTAVAVDNNDRAYVTGYTSSSMNNKFPANGGPNTSQNGAMDVFIARVSANGTSLEYCGYIGGSGIDQGKGVAVDNYGRAYVTGFTVSTETQSFPLVGGLDRSYNGGDWDAFVARVKADGTGLEYSGYIGGSEYDEADAIAVDNSGRAYVFGYTRSGESQSFPVKEGPDTSYNGGGDSFLASVATDGNSLEYCGYIGGQNVDKGYGIALDSSGRVYVTGYTMSNDTQGFPVLGGLDTSYNGGTADAFAACVAAGGTSLEYCGYIGGGGFDWAKGIAVSSDGEAYVTGYTDSSETQGFSVKGSPDTTFNGGTYDAFIAHIRMQGPDLMADIENPPAEMASGGKAAVTAIVINNGEEATEKASAQFYVGDQLLATKNISKLKPGKSKKLKVKLNVPVMSGTDTLKVEVIPSGEDVGKYNNTDENPVKIVLPDLTISSPQVKGTLVPGKSGTITVKAANLTIATAEKSMVRITRAKDQTVLGEKKLSRLKQTEKDLSIKIKIPEDFQVGNEAVWIMIDPDKQIPEESELNNLILMIKV
ncbi:MAG: SBBP repeat-containing protein [Chitinophagales bacterium]